MGAKCHGKIMASTIGVAIFGVELGDFDGNRGLRLVHAMYPSSGSTMVVEPYSCHKSL
jgi:hypothetical protein